MYIGEYLEYYISSWMNFKQKCNTGFTLYYCHGSTLVGSSSPLSHSLTTLSLSHSEIGERIGEVNV